MDILTWALGLAVPVLIAIVSYIMRQQGAMWRKIDEQTKELSAYKVHVAEHYVSARTFEKFESRVLDAIEDLKKIVRQDIADHRRS